MREDVAGKELGPVEGWIVVSRNGIGFVKGCKHPLPFLHAVLRVSGGSKYWSTVPRAASLPEGFTVKPVDCVGGRRVLLVNPSKVSLVSPVEALRRLRSCTLSVCRAARELAGLLEGGEWFVGVTGGLAYNPRGASDVDLVVYARRPWRVYKLLRRLREEGVTRPYHGVGHGWSVFDSELHSVLAGGRVLFGLFKGYEYNVKIVPCLGPSRCRPVKLLATRVRLYGVLRPLSPYTIPATYALEVAGGSLPAWRDAGRIVLLTYRLRYTEIPPSKVEVVGGLEEWAPGHLVLVPDHGGYIRILKLLA